LARRRASSQESSQEQCHDPRRAPLRCGYTARFAQLAIRAPCPVMIPSPRRRRPRWVTTGKRERPGPPPAVRAVRLGRRRSGIRRRIASRDRADAPPGGRRQPL